MPTTAVVGVSAVALVNSGASGVTKLDSAVGVRLPSGRLPVALTCAGVREWRGRRVHLGGAVPNDSALTPAHQRTRYVVPGSRPVTGQLLGVEQTTVMGLPPSTGVSVTV